MASPSLAKMVLTMADSREEVTRRIIGLDDMMQYRILCTALILNDGSLRGRVEVSPSGTMCVFSQNGYEVKSLKELSLSNGGPNSWTFCLTHLLNTLVLHGYEFENGQTLHTIHSSMIESNKTS